MRRGRTVGLLALLALVVIVPSIQLCSCARPPRDPAALELTFVGGGACRDCHIAEYDLWQGSDHDKAMDVATDESVLGDFDDATFSDGRVTSRFYRRDGAFFVDTEGPDGEMAEFEITHVFGHDPLQQYLVPFPGGRLQALNVTWDAVRNRWYKQYPGQDILPGDWLHWTRGAQNWNGMCAECHSTNLKKGYDPATDTYHTTWSDIDVGCEACHGPGSRHVAWAEIPPAARPDVPAYGLAVKTSDISPRRLVEMCVPCHSRRAEFGDYDHTGAGLLDHMLPSLLEEGLYFADGQIQDEVYVYGSFLQSRMYAEKVSCHDCHDSHSLQLRRAGNELCLQCHERGTFDTSAHHFHEKTIEGKESDGALCVKCHMVERAYMVIDWRADHSLRVPRPDLSAGLGTPNACTQSGCHDDRPLQWSVDAYRKWYGESAKPHFGTTFAAARAGDPAALPELVRLADSDLVSPIVRATAIDLLSRSSSAGGDAAILSALASPEPLLRATAAADSPLTSPGDIRRLAPLLSDPLKAVRIAAAFRLAGVPRDLLDPPEKEAFERAIAEYRESMAYTLDFAGSAYNLGNLEATLGNSTAAERHYRHALAIDDKFAPAKANLAILLSSLGRNEEAEALLREILRDYPDDADAMASLGLLRFEMGDPGEALTLLGRAAEARPDDARVHRNLGLLLQQMGRPEEAGLALRRAYELAPADLDIMHALADHLIRRGRLDEASRLADRMIELYPGQPVGHQMKAAAGR